MSELTSKDEDKAKGLANMIADRLEEIVNKYQNTKETVVLPDREALPILFSQGLGTIDINGSQWEMKSKYPCSVVWTGEKFEVYYKGESQ